MVLIAALLGFYQSALAEGSTNSEDADLSFLPPAKEEQNTEADQNKTTSNKVENAFEKKRHFEFSLDNIFQTIDRKDRSDLLFNISASNAKKSPNWNNLTRIGMRGDASLHPNLSFKSTLLLNAYTREDDHFSSSKDLRLDIKEAYLSWQQSPTQFYDIGRINIKNGVATGFNPTDYFKIGSLLDRNTEDVSQLRDARIGALVFRGQKLWDSGSFSVVVSPKISNKKDHWTTNKDIYGLNLHKSNDRSSVMLKLNQNFADDFSPEVIYYNESGRHNFGLNISRSFNDQWLGYAEWNIGERRKLIDEAFQKPRNNQGLHPAIAKQFSKDSGESYQQQFAVGLSYTSSQNITTNIEYHYNQAGLSKSQSKRWFTLADQSNKPAILGQLLSVRGLAQNRNEPLGQNSLFLRSKWSDAIMDKLDFTGLLIADLNDNSHLMQLESEYELNPKSSLSLQLTKYQGDRKSIYGSLENDMTATVQFKYSF